MGMGTQIAQGFIDKKMEDDKRREAVEAQQYMTAISMVEQMKANKMNTAYHMLESNWTNKMAELMQQAKEGTVIDYGAEMAPILEQSAALAGITPTLIQDYMKSFGIDMKMDDKYGGFFNAMIGDPDLAANSTQQLYGNPDAAARFAPGIREALNGFRLYGQTLVTAARGEGTAAYRLGLEEQIAKHTAQGTQMLESGMTARSALAQSVFQTDIFDQNADPTLQAQLVDASLAPADRAVTNLVAAYVNRDPQVFADMASIDPVVARGATQKFYNDMLPGILASYFPQASPKLLGDLKVLMTDPRAVSEPRAEFAYGQILARIGPHITNAAKLAMGTSDESLSAMGKAMRDATDGNQNLTADQIQTALVNIGGKIAFAGNRMSSRFVNEITDNALKQALETALNDPERAMTTTEIMGMSHDRMRDRARILAEWADPLSPDSLNEAMPEMRRTINEAEKALKTTLAVYGVDNYGTWDPLSRQWVVPYVPDGSGQPEPPNGVRGTGFNNHPRTRAQLEREKAAAQQTARVNAENAPPDPNATHPVSGITDWLQQGANRAGQEASATAAEEGQLAALPQRAKQGAYAGAKMGMEAGQSLASFLGGKAGVNEVNDIYRGMYGQPTKDELLNMYMQRERNQGKAVKPTTEMLKREQAIFDQAPTGPKIDLSGLLPNAGLGKKTGMGPQGRQWMVVLPDGTVMGLDVASTPPEKIQQLIRAGARLKPMQ